ncbi:MAG: DUF4238 domain-containing protein [Planctomycetales bacterium]|nr:DUF4238 domain-containing protein [Planctomycetales bacterium]
MTQNLHNKKNRRTERQHYVSQFYLRGFTNAVGRLFCFDKVSVKSYPTSTEAAAQEPNFYEIPSGSLEGVEVPVNVIENALASIERMWAPIHADLISNADAGIISEALKRDYSPFLVIQWMRTRAYRDWMYATTQLAMQSFADELVEANFPGESVQITVGKELLPAMHAKKLLDLDEVEKMACHLIRHRWVIGINDTEHLFYTSDHPVVRRANRTLAGRPMVGILDPGVEIVFPLDSRHILLVLEREHFTDWAEHENRAVVLSQNQVRAYNSLQVMRCDKRLLCADDDFDIAREICAAHPEVRNPDRPRVLVETTPIKDMKNHMFVIALE